jgi:nucleotide-binding universal stress UspA family protein
MSELPSIFDVPYVNSVLHPSDFSPASESAFAHALLVALRRKTRFTILHVGTSEDIWTKFPAVRDTLEKWGFLKEGSPRSAVFKELSINVEKIGIKGRNPVNAILDFIDEVPTDLIVLATEGRDGIPRWLKPSIAEQIAQKSDTMTLFVPAEGTGFVSPEDGTVSLKRILLPVDHKPSPRFAIEYAKRTSGLAENPVEIILLHVGEAKFSNLGLPEEKSIKWRWEYKQGDVVETISKTAEENKVDLIIMPTAGHEGFLDALRGSITEQVLRQSYCPLLAIPIR